VINRIRIDGYGDPGFIHPQVFSAFPMVTDPLVQQQPATLSASKLPLLLRAVADPEGKGEISTQDAASIKRVETNLVCYRGETDKSAQDSSNGQIGTCPT